MKNERRKKMLALAIHFLNDANYIVGYENIIELDEGVEQDLGGLAEDLKAEFDIDDEFIDDVSRKCVIS